MRNELAISNLKYPRELLHDEFIRKVAEETCSMPVDLDPLAGYFKKETLPLTASRPLVACCGEEDYLCSHYYETAIRQERGESRVEANLVGVENLSEVYETRLKSVNRHDPNFPAVQLSLLTDSLDNFWQETDWFKEGISLFDAFFAVYKRRNITNLEPSETALVRSYLNRNMQLFDANNAIRVGNYLKTMALVDKDRQKKIIIIANHWSAIHFQKNGFYPFEEAKSQIFSRMTKLGIQRQKNSDWWDNISQINKLLLETYAFSNALHDELMDLVMRYKLDEKEASEIFCEADSLFSSEANEKKIIDTISGKLQSEKRTVTDQIYWQEIYDKHHGEIGAYITGRILPIMVEDLTQEVFAKAASSYKENISENIRPLLFRIASNVIKDWYRSNERHPMVHLSDIMEESTDYDFLVGNSAGERDDYIFTRSQLMDFIENLPYDQKKVIELSLSGFGNLEIAHQLDKTEGAVKSLQHRAIDHLRRDLGVEENLPLAILQKI